MPGGNGKGPMGMGPMTGRAAGFCAGRDAPGFGSPATGRGYGRGRGRGMFGGFGRGFRNMFQFSGQPGWARPGSGPETPENPAVADERETLTRRAADLQAELETVRQRLGGLDGSKGEER